MGDGWLVMTNHINKSHNHGSLNVHGILKSHLKSRFGKVCFKKKAYGLDWERKGNFSGTFRISIKEQFQE